MLKETPEKQANSFVHLLKRLPIQDVFLFGGLLLFFVVASLGYGSNSSLSASATVLEGRFDALQKNKMYKDIGYSYDLLLLGSSQKYIITADYANCLDVELFDAAVKKGDVLSITTEDKNQALVLSIKKEATTLMDINCVDTKTEHISIYVPLLIAICIVLIWWLRRKVKQDRAAAETDAP
jgi:hypothetical protein